MQDTHETPTAGEGSGEWMPPPGATTHAGKPIPADAEFFRPPPQEIGEIVSAFTTLKRHKRPVSSLRVLMWVLILAAVVLGGLEVLRRTGSPLSKDDVRGARVVIGVILPVVFLIALAVTRFRHSCTYVGKGGLATFRIRSSRAGPVQEDVFLFADASYLTTDEVRHYINGVYSGTTYNYSWWNDAGARLFKLDGQHSAKKKLPKPWYPYHFALAAQDAWCQYRLGGLGDEIGRQGYIRFPMLGKGGAVRAVRLGPGFVEFEFSGRTERVEASDFGNARIAQGTLTFTHRDAKWFSKWFSGKGEFSFTYRGLGNAKLFLLCLERLAGIKLA